VSGCRRLSRRTVIELGAALPLAALVACRDEPPPAETVVELAALPEGKRVVVMHGDEPVELLRTGQSVSARSLWCTHTGCRVNWIPERDHYQCLCHDGRFDADGNVLLGPPTRPLRQPPFELREGAVVLLAAAATP
jgi:Rieske Fe-S protein